MKAKKKTRKKGRKVAPHHKHLDERHRSLLHRLRLIEAELHTLESKFYRVCIFGSARIKPEHDIYEQVHELAYLISKEGIDILTGGGPGLMEAANKGAKEAQKYVDNRSRSFGLPVELEWEPIPNAHLDVKRHHHSFSSRLDDFMRLSHSVICTPGGIGTLLELMFAWQLIQVKHLESRPIVLMDEDYWTGVIDWMKQVPLARGLISEKDFDFISIVDTPKQAFEIIHEHHADFLVQRETMLADATE